MVQVSLKMETMARYKKGTCVYGPVNYPLCYNYAQRRQWKFAKIRGYLSTGTMFAPMQGAYEKEAKVLVSLIMQIMARCKKGTCEYGQQTTTSAAATHNAVNANLSKFGATSSPVQFFHQCKVDIKRKLRCW